MKTIFDKATHDSLIGRIKTLNEHSQPLWGTMTVYQMLKHCRMWEELILGKKHYKQMFLGRLIGKWVLKAVIKDDAPMRKNAATVPEFRIKEVSGDWLGEKNKWLSLMEEQAHFSAPFILHPFFGKMTKQEIGILAYKHIDHHLRQFNA